MLTELLYFINVYDLTNETKYNASDGRQMTEFNEKTYPKRKEKLFEFYLRRNQDHVSVLVLVLFTRLIKTFNYLYNQPD